MHGNMDKEELVEEHVNVIMKKLVHWRFLGLVHAWDIVHVKFVLKVVAMRELS